VFKQFDKNILFHLSWSDVRERFHLCILLLVVVIHARVYILYIYTLYVETRYILYFISINPSKNQSFLEQFFCRLGQTRIYHALQ